MEVSADERYEAIRASPTDVAEIANNIGIKLENIQKVKDHLFHNEHLLDRYTDLGEPAVMARFDSSKAIARVWELFGLVHSRKRIYNYCDTRRLKPIGCERGGRVIPRPTMRHRNAIPPLTSRIESAIYKSR